MSHHNSHAEYLEGLKLLLAQLDAPSGKEDAMRENLERLDRHFLLSPLCDGPCGTDDRPALVEIELKVFHRTEGCIGRQHPVIEALTEELHGIHSWIFEQIRGRAETLGLDIDDDDLLRTWEGLAVFA